MRFVLKRQLAKAGASDIEAAELSHLGERLQRMQVPHLGPEAKGAIARELGISTRARRVQLGLAYAGGLAAIAAVLVVSSLHATPGSPAYKVRHPLHQQAQPAYHPVMLPPTEQPLTPITPPPQSVTNPATKQNTQPVITPKKAATKPTTATGTDSENGSQSSDTSGNGYSNQGDTKPGNFLEKTTKNLMNLL